jgi:hypothetical protein
MLKEKICFGRENHLKPIVSKFWEDTGFLVLNQVMDIITTEFYNVNWYPGV